MSIRENDLSSEAGKPISDEPFDLSKVGQPVRPNPFNFEKTSSKPPQPSSIMEKYREMNNPAKIDEKLWTDSIRDSFQNPDVINQIESEYPLMMKEYRKIMFTQYELFCKKQIAYGRGNILLGGDIDKEEDRHTSLVGLTIRINDKVQRLINLVIKNRTNHIADESTTDTFMDLSVYGIIAQLVQKALWCK